MLTAIASALSDTGRSHEFLYDVEGRCFVTNEFWGHFHCSVEAHILFFIKDSCCTSKSDDRLQ